MKDDDCWYDLNQKLGIGNRELVLIGGPHAEDARRVDASSCVLVIKPISGKERPAEDATAQRNLVRIFEIAANGYATGNYADLQGKVLNPFVDIKCGCIPFHGGAEGENDFLDLGLSAAEPLNKGLDLQITGTNAVDRRNDAPQHVVQSHILGGVFNGHDIARVLHNANDGTLAFVACTDRTHIGVGNIKAEFTEPYPGAQVIQGFREGHRIFRPFFDQVQHQAQGRLFPDTRKFRDLVDRLFNKFGWKFHVCL